MFEQYPQKRLVIARRRMERDLVAVVALIALFTAAGATALQLSIGLESPTVATTARARIIDADEQEVVPPLTNTQVARATLEIRGGLLALRSVSFLLDGVYDANEIEGIAITVDGIQAGLPVLPDEHGAVHFTIETLTLREGEHEVEVLVDAPEASPGAVLLVRFSADSFVMESAAGRRSADFLLPFETSPLAVLPHGSVQAFAGPEDESIYLYARGEEMVLTEMRFAGNEAVGGFAFDAFIGDRFLGRSVFDNSSAVLDLRKEFIRVTRRKNLSVRLIPDGTLPATARILLQEISGTGIRSGENAVFPQSLQVLSGD